MIYQENMQQIENTLKALIRNNMDAKFFPDCSGAYDYVKSILFDGAVIACGGSQSIRQSGLEELFKSGKYHYLDRSQVSAKEAPALYRESFFSDFYFTSTNALTENGELYNVDGNSNRIAAYCYGPKNVIVITGYNKIVKDIDAAILRVKTIAAPMNTKRLDCKTPCFETGECSAVNSKSMTAGCESPQRICCNYLISAQQREKGRIKVLVIGESLGF